MKKLLSLLGAAGLLLASGSSVMSFSYIDNQPVNPTTVLNSELALPDLHDVIFQTSLGTIGDLDPRLVTDTDGNISMKDNDLIDLIKLYNPDVNASLRVDFTRWDDVSRLASAVVVAEGYSSEVVVTFQVPRGVWEIADHFYAGAFITQRADGSSVNITDEMVLNRWYALNKHALPRTVSIDQVHYKSFNPQHYGEITIDNYSGRYTILWWDVKMPAKINTNLTVKAASQQGIIDAFKAANPSLKVLLNDPSVIKVQILSNDLATLRVKVGNDLLLYSAVFFQVA